jgi:2-polyprenyl-3-methyl-5-hydroxy-6-metoxy-1,4-benzoquinol methylase
MANGEIQKKSAEAAQTVDEFWKEVHKADEVLWLSDYPGPEIWQRLGVVGRIRPGATVLNIGIGLGRCTRALHDAGCVVHAMDISPLALERVSDFATTWLASDADKLPGGTFDVVLSHLVAQHMRDGDLIQQIRTVLPALKHNGVFAMQFSTLENEQSMVSETLDNIKDGRVLRTPQEMRKLVAQAGGFVRRMLKREHHAHARVTWWVVQISRRPWWRPI